MLLGSDVVHPWWLERQLDAAGPSFVPGGGGDPPANVAHRDWTLLGTLSSLERATVDPRGMVTPVEGGWSLDWWVGSGERWHLPSREPAVRQSLVEGTPVVETAMRVPNGDVVHRAFAVRGADGSSSVVVEIENRSVHAVALALVVRPWNATGPARIGRVAVEGAVIEVDDRSGVLLDRIPAAVHLASAPDGVLAELGGPADAAPGRPTGPSEPLTAADGSAEAAVIVPLPHTAIVHAVLPLPSSLERRPRGRRAAVATIPDPLPTAEQVASGWVVQGRRGPSIELPDDRLAAVVEANRRHLLLVHAGEDLAAVPVVPFDYTEAAVELAALDAFGFDDEAAMVLGTWEERQALDGHLLGDDRRWDANGAALTALATHWRLTGDLALAEALVGPVAKAAHWIAKRRSSRRGRRTTDTVGLMPDGVVPSWLGPPGASFRTDWWSLRGLRDAAALLAALDQPDAAADAEATAAELEATLAEAMATAAAAHGGVLPAGPDRGVDGGIVAVVDGVLLGVLDPAGPLVTATLEVVAERYTTDGAVVQAVGAAGLSPRLTARLARAELVRGDPRALDRLSWLVDHATPTLTWPEVAHPRSGGGVAGAGHDGVAVAEVLLAVRDLLVHAEPDGLVLAPVVPDTWLGQGWAVHDLPTEVGRFGYAVRWHGDRAALLWELEARPGRGPVRLRAPGLDPGWSTTETSGEALLGPVRPRTPIEVVTEGPPADAPTTADEGADAGPAPTPATVEVPLPPVRRPDPSSPGPEPAGPEPVDPDVGGGDGPGGGGSFS